MRHVHAITSAGRSQAEQQHDRVVRYLWTMGIRMVFFFLAILVHNWWSIVFLIGSILLPWIAVVYANSGAERRVVPSTYLDNHTIESGPADNRPGPESRPEDDDGSPDL
ncbi:DUF3099 domain-containing protein [Pseudactinotalea sp. HY158]|uniref:DUF3099 domain-containing protein n=1 Tax=unclassified Pseudactinotalea TaxID=2649176 RepID=UPI00128DC92F|nr:DUF3099 domain-containing protein [Pseudactinotalea sp. HY158]MPV49843.1 DUF3099 domain-containing protein [Pseudactinotalea sp. HY160]QGH69111.1 DUF3099 domain-containing protein [Pseudactinotalea sp. HY158]